MYIILGREAAEALKENHTILELETLENNNNAIDMSEWLDMNCKHKVSRLGRRFVFESSAEAEWFILRWL
jgi:hypothetical protein